MTKTRIGSAIAACTAAALMFMLAGTASAQQLRMSGGWLQQRGEVNIPAWIVQLGPLNSSLLGLDDPTIPGSDFVTVTPQTGLPAQVKVPQGAFRIAENSRAIPLQQALSSLLGAGNGGNVVQLTTTFTFSGPGQAETLAAFGTAGEVNQRLAPNFSYCPGALNNPNCATNIAGGNDGTRAGRVTYTAGPNQYGGTMGMLITGGGSTAVSLGGSPARLQINVIAGAGSQEVGLSYGFTSSVILVGGQEFSSFTKTPNGLVGGLGALTNTGMPDVNINTGFPWTTGMVTVSEPGGATAMDASEMFVATGDDNRTPGGRGTLSLVAGGISFRQNAGQTFVSLDRINMDIASGQLTPALSPTGVAAIASLLLIGGGYVLRKRL